MRVQRDPRLVLRLGCGNIRQLGFPPGLPLALRGVCRGSVSSGPPSMEARSLRKGTNILITNTGACILSASYVASWENKIIMAKSSGQRCEQINPRVSRKQAVKGGGGGSVI